MIKALGKSLLLLLLLALAGQALASCHSAPPEVAQAGTAMHAGHASEANAESGEARKPAVHHPQRQDGDGNAAECELSCCPGHCTSALPASALKTSIYAPVAAADTYSDFSSVPAPETTIRPPISA